VISAGWFIIDLKSYRSAPHRRTDAGLCDGYKGLVGIFKEGKGAFDIANPMDKPIDLYLKDARHFHEPI
jgi:hypothetical protein